MAEALEWYFRLFDGISGPTGGMTNALDRVNAVLQVAGASTETAQGGFDALAPALARTDSAARKTYDSLVKVNHAVQIANDLAKQRRDIDVAHKMGALSGEEHARLSGAIDTAAGGKRGVIEEALAGGTGFITDKIGVINGMLGPLGGAFASAVAPFALGIGAAVIGVGLLKGAFDAVVDAAIALVEKTYDIGKSILEMGAKAERSSLSFNLLLGPEQGKQVLGYIKEITKDAGFLGGELKAAAAHLVVGFKAAEIPKALSAAQDLAAISPDLGLSGAAQILNRARLEGRIERRQLRPLGIDFGSDFIPKLAAILKVDKETAKKRMEAGTAGGEAVTTALYQSIMAKTGGPLGKAGLALGDTADVLISKIKDLPNRYLTALTAGGTSEGALAFKDMLRNLNEALDPTSVAGQHAIKVLSDLFSDVIKFITGPATGQSGLERMTMFVVKMVQTVETIVQYLIIFAHGLGYLLNKVMGPAGYLGGVSGGSTLKPFEGGAVGFGKSVPSALAGGMSAPEALASMPGVENMSIPAMAAGGIVDRPMLALVGEAGPEAVVPLSGAQIAGGAGGRMGNVYQVTVPVEYHDHGPGSSTEESRAELAEMIQQLIIDAFAKIDEEG